MCIRTTVTLDEDVLRRLKQESRRRGTSLRQTINDVLRSGLLMGTYPGLNYDNIHELLDLVEGEERRC